MLVPILIACFVRADKLAEVVKPLIDLKNPIYVVIDAPRNSFDSDKIAEVHKVLENSLLRIYKVLTFPRNQGTNSVALGVDWVLKDFDSVIVIEEDVLVSTEFIDFAQRMLERYSMDNRVGSITAMNLVPTDQLTAPQFTYRFSCYFYAWGWATWKNRWDKMIPLEDWAINRLRTPKSARHPLAKRRWKSGMREVYSGREPGLWDYRWIYTYWMNQWLTIVPNINLAINIGFDTEATHTRLEPIWAPKKIDKLPDSLKVIESVEQDLKADRWSAKYIHNTSWQKLLKTKIKHLFRGWTN